jgi:imidazolonepropionase-like amidohydrolase
MKSSSLPALLVAIAAAPALAQSPPPPQALLITNVHLDDGVEAPRVSILLEGGRVAEILEDGAELPAGVRVLDGDGSLALPAFVDAWTVAGIETPEPVAEQDAMSSLVGSVHIGMREANRKGLQPALRGASRFALEEDALEGYREQGFGAVHSAPSGQLLAGQTVVATLRDGALRDRVVTAGDFLAAELRASGQGYPSTLMGYLAHLRQFFLDARWHALRLERFAAGKMDPRPPHDPELEALQPVLAGERTLLARADEDADILRWLKFAAAQEVNLVVCGGREAWRVTDQLLASGVPVLLELDWGDEVEDPDAEEKPADAPGEEGHEEIPPGGEGATEAPPNPEAGQGEPDQEPAPEAPDTAEAAEEPSEDPEAGAAAEPNWIYEEPVAVRRERRRLWEERRDCALRLHEAGVPFAFATGAGSAADLVKNVRRLVELGLPEEAALAALTRSAADLVGAGRQLGRLERGRAACIALWSDSPFAKKSRLTWLVVDGELHTYADEEQAAAGPAEGVDASGTWEVAYEDQSGRPALLELNMAEDGSVEGSLSFERPDGSSSSAALSGQVAGRNLTLEGPIDLGNFQARIKVTGRLEGDSMSGDAVWKFSGGEDSNSFTARRKPEGRWETGGHDHGHPHGAEQ